MTRGGSRTGAGRKPKGVHVHKIAVPDLVWQRIWKTGKLPAEEIIRIVERELEKVDAVEKSC